MDDARRLLRLGGSPGAGPALWRSATEAQWERVGRAADALLGDTPNDPAELARRHDTLGYECHFLLVAIRNVRIFAIAIADSTDDARIRDAVAAFDSAAPSAKALRDYATHLDEYLRGRGH